MTLPERLPERLPELLAPAGSLEKLETALLYGADAVYAGFALPEREKGVRGAAALHLRAGASLDFADLPRALELVRSHGKRLYVTLNAFPRQRDLPAVHAALERLAAHPPDGLIVADPGVMALARRELPGVGLHVSTQAHVTNAEAVRVWLDAGAKRVNLARELDLLDIRDIGRDIGREVPEAELEVFVHGAACLAFSGRCLLSAWLNDRPANLGRCTQVCRFEYRPTRLALEERLRPDRETWELVEGQGFSTLLAPEDVCLLPFLPWLARRAAALKIEGRTKSPVYLAQVVDAYRCALDAIAAGTFLPDPYLDSLRAAAHRTLCSGFFLPGRRLSWEPPDIPPQPVVARLEDQLGPGRWSVSVRGRWLADQTVELLAPGMRRIVIAPGEYGLEDHHGSRTGLLHPGTVAVLHCEHPNLTRGLFLAASI